MARIIFSKIVFWLVIEGLVWNYLLIRLNKQINLETAPNKTGIAGSLLLAWINFPEGHFQLTFYIILKYVWRLLQLVPVLRFRKVLNHELGQADAWHVSRRSPVLLGQRQMPESVRSWSTNPQAVGILLDTRPSRKLCLQHDWDGYFLFLLRFLTLILILLVLIIPSIILNWKWKWHILILIFLIRLLARGEIVVPYEIATLQFKVLNDNHLTLVDGPAGTQQVDVAIGSLCQIDFDRFVLLGALDVLDLVVWWRPRRILPILCLLLLHYPVDYASDEAVGRLDHQGSHSGYE